MCRGTALSVRLHTLWSSFFFFFSSRRRHTRLVSDWSSDVCSSDLKHNVLSHRVGIRVHVTRRSFGGRAGMHAHPGEVVAEVPLHVLAQRRLERRAEIGRASCRERV